MRLTFLFTKNVAFLFACHIIPVSQDGVWIHYDTILNSTEVIRLTFTPKPE